MDVGAGAAGPRLKTAETFMNWSRLGVWERRLNRAQKDCVKPGMMLLDGTGLRPR